LTPALLDSQQMIDQAQRDTGLADWGQSRFPRHLEVLLRALNTEAHLHELGRMRAHHRLLIMLRARLHLVDDRKRFPQIAQQEIRKPILVVGLPRAGTTFMHKLLASDPVHRSPLAWEILFPSPPPERASYARDPRIARATAAFEEEGFMQPQIQACHAWDATLAEECNFIWEHSMLSVDFSAWWDVPSYSKYLMEQDFGEVYEVEKQVLQQLQYRCAGERWVLKTPAHMLWLKDMFAVFPDACLVMCHRDPLKALASLSDLLYEMRRLFSDQVEPGDFGMIEINAYGANQATAFRERPEYKNRFFDVNFLDVQKDPMGTVKRIYDHFGIDLGAERELAMRESLERDRERHGKSGRHSYSAEKVALDLERLNRHWSPYLERYRVPLER
jgi:hypothetical protein